MSELAPSEYYDRYGKRGDTALVFYTGSDGDLRALYAHETGWNGEVTVRREQTAAYVKGDSVGKEICYENHRFYVVREGGEPYPVSEDYFRAVYSKQIPEFDKDWDNHRWLPPFDLLVETATRIHVPSGNPADSVVDALHLLRAARGVVMGEEL